MKHLLAALLISALFPCIAVKAGKYKPKYHGANEIVAVVNGKAITYHEMIGHADMGAEIEYQRRTRKLPETMSDGEIERQLVYAQVEVFIIRHLLDAEADKIKFKITDSHIRSILMRERKLLGMKEEDEREWADYVRERYGDTPTEYRERRRGEIRRQQVQWMMAGAQGALPKQHPLEIYFALNVTPRDIRREFLRERDRYKIAFKIDYERFKLLYPKDTSLDNQRKLWTAVTDEKTGVRARVLNAESFKAATDGLDKLVKRLKLPGLSVKLSKRKKVKDDTDLDSFTYQQVLAVPADGGVSELGAIRETIDDTEYNGWQFIRLYSKVEGDARRFNDPKVQASIRDGLWQRKLAENVKKVEKALLKRASIVPERLVAR